MEEEEAITNSGIPLLQNSNYPPNFTTSSLSASFKLDEGYSDETRGQVNCDLNPPPHNVMSLPHWLLAQSEADRAGEYFVPSWYFVLCLPITLLAELAYSLLRTVRTSTVAAIVERLAPLLHKDPVIILPPEITFEIFSYVDAKTLIAASAASRAWRNRVLDPRLWRDLYIQEGWLVDTDAIEKFERAHSESASPQSRKSRTRLPDSDVGEPKLKKRVPPTWLGSRNVGSRSSQETEDNEQMEGDCDGDHDMSDVLDDHHMSSTILSEPPPHPSVAVYCPLKSSLLTRLPNGTVKVNWQHLYKQRRRLEDNWLKARYTNFQLPHPLYAEEAHEECVYAIQFSGKWLVSGSRDRTVRVWDLETKRLRYPPLLGHEKSVLCLQFDPSPSEDIIMSGSSDTSVILWRFSTGELIHRIPHAHDDSVLNVKYDKRYLVTCSKDMVIKVWNRRDLLPTDPDYPSVYKGANVTYPSYIIDTTYMSPSTLEADIANGQIQKLAPYSLLMTIEGHLAAVNSIQITDDEIVSASGDRLIKIWNIHNGTCKKTLVGHEKGIACVQFDGRRIISGSNDNTVRIYDHASGAEVACLQGHGSLVRAVQAGFGDPPGAGESMRREAEAVDEDFLENHQSGALADLSPGPPRHHARDPTGSRDPRNIQVLGASIPPGGGGGKWGRIVSGSYDEYVLIWRKDHEGKWVVSQRLHQAAAVARASRAPSRAPRLMQEVQNQMAHVTAQGSLNAGESAYPPRFPVDNPGNAQASASQTAQAQGPSNQPEPSVVPAPAVPITPHPQVVINGQAINRARPQLPPHHHHPARRHPNQGFQPVQQMVPRVFKLQFDAHKIVCSSQDPRIVAWDFSCDDEEIAEACQFFIGL